METTIWIMIGLILFIVSVLPTSGAILALLSIIVLLLSAIALNVKDLNTPKDPDSK